MAQEAAIKVVQEGIDPLLARDQVLEKNGYTFDKGKIHYNPNHSLKGDFKGKAYPVGEPYPAVYLPKPTKSRDIKIRLSMIQS